MKVYLWNNFHEFHIYRSSKCFLYEQQLVCIYHKNTREYSNLTSVFFWIWRLFSWAVSSWTLETQSLYISDCSFVKSDKYSSSEVSLSSFPLFPSSEALFLRWWNLIYLQNLFWSFEFTWYLYDILYKKLLKQFF